MFHYSKISKTCVRVITELTSYIIFISALLIYLSVSRQNKVGKNFTPRHWITEIAKANYNINQSIWNELCSETASPIENKKKTPQRRLHLVVLLKNY